MVLLSHDRALGVSGHGLDRDRRGRPSETDRALLIALLEGAAESDIERRADDLLRHYSSLPALLHASPESIDRIGGPGSKRVIEAAHSLVQRATREEVEDRPLLGSTTEVVRYMRALLAHRSCERAQAIFLDSANRLVADEAVATGTADRVIIYPREIVRRALELGACSIILAHNHPSGDLVPSEEDIATTRQLSHLCTTFDIRLLDHIVIARTGHASLRAMRLF